MVVFNTCAVRENADNKLCGNLSHLVPRKQGDPDMQIAVGGCLAQKDATRAPRPVGGCRLRHAQHRVAADAARRARRKAAQVEIVEALQEFPSNLPAARESAYAARFDLRRVQQHLRSASSPRCAAGGRPQARRVLAEVQSLVDQGVLE